MMKSLYISNVKTLALSLPYSLIHGYHYVPDFNNADIRQTF